MAFSGADMKNPILIFESYDLAIYRSAHQASLHLEKVDVENKIYDAYDSDGFLLDIVIKLMEVEHKLFNIRWKESKEVIAIEEHHPKIDCSEKVLHRLVQYLKSPKCPEEDLKNLSLNELIKLASKRMGWKVDLPE